MTLNQEIENYNLDTIKIAAAIARAEERRAGGRSLEEIYLESYAQPSIVWSGLNRAPIDRAAMCRPLRESSRHDGALAVGQGRARDDARIDADRDRFREVLAHFVDAQWGAS